MKENEDNKRIFEQKLAEIKIKAKQNHVPIILDETLEKIYSTIGDKKLDSILEIGTAVRIFFSLFF